MRTCKGTLPSSVESDILTTFGACAYAQAPKCCQVGYNVTAYAAI